MDHTLFTALRQFCTVPSCQNDEIWLYGSFVYFHWPDALLGPSLDNADLLLALVITPGF